MSFESTHGRRAFDQMAAAECERDDRIAARDQALAPLLALQRIRSNAQMAMAGGALFDLQRCVALCDAALSGEPCKPNPLAELRNAQVSAELLDALQYALKGMELERAARLATDPTVGIHAAAIAVARAAIAKATGSAAA